LLHALSQYPSPIHASLQPGEHLGMSHDMTSRWLPRHRQSADNGYDYNDGGDDNDYDDGGDDNDDNYGGDDYDNGGDDNDYDDDDDFTDDD